MTTTELFNGIAVVIDDEIDQGDENLNNLIKQIEKQDMPYVKYNKLPDKRIFSHFKGISFLLLDWELRTEEINKVIPEGVKIPKTLYKSIIKSNIEFLNAFRQTCFAPVFIFTNVDKGSVIEELKKNGLYLDNKPNDIFVKNKVELKGYTRLFNTIEDWANKTPSIYILKEWEKEYGKAKVKLFRDFYKMSPSWPKVLWRNFIKDETDPSGQLGELITRNLLTRMTPFAFDNKNMYRRGIPHDINEIRRVLQGERFIGNDSLQQDSISTGDVFDAGSGNIYLNIRPECDCIARSGSSVDEIDLYLIKGSKLSEEKVRKHYNREYGNIKEIDTQSIVFSLRKGKAYDFRFDELFIKKWSEFKDNRLGRLLPPYITRIQQRYSLYLQRQGLSRIPKEAITKKSRNPRTKDKI